MESFSHKPVMLAEVLAALRPGPGGVFIDGTIGGAGHAEAMLEASAPDGKLYGCDRDDRAVAAAASRLARFAGRWEIRRGSFEEFTGWISPDSVDGAVLDLGLSSPQIDGPERGFSFQQEGPLDMRMDTRQSLTAERLVNEASPQDLARWFRELAGEHQAFRLARAIDQARQTAPIRTTKELASIIERTAPRRGARIHPATRVFQALRMVVNDELGTLDRGLKAIWPLLNHGGRLAVITFHSLEDRMVKVFGRERVRDYAIPGEVDVPELRQPVVPQAVWVTRKAIQPSDEEIAGNPRSRSAQLRVLERI